MADTIDVIGLRLNAVNLTQRRVGVSLMLCAAAAAVVLAAIWNLYLSWDRRWIEGGALEGPLAQLQNEQIGQWVANNTIDVPLLGIRLSSSDAAFPGALGLVVLAFYHCVCARRENHEVADLLRDACEYPLPTRRAVFAGIRALMTSTDFDGPEVYYELSPKVPVSKPVWFLGRAHQLLVFTPAIAITLIVASDVYYAFGYTPVFAPQGTSMDPWTQFQLMFVDSLAFGFGVLAVRYAWLAKEFRRGTHALMLQFQGELDRASRGEQLTA